MANLLFRYSSSLACVPLKLALGRRRKTALAHIVGGVHFEGARMGLSLKYKQKTQKNEPEKTKQGFVLFSFFRFIFLHFLPILQLKTNSCPFSMDLSDNVSKDYVLSPFSDKIS